MVRLQSEPILAEDLVKAVGSEHDGAVALFLGTVRDRNAGRRVLCLEYQAYPAMAEAEMTRIERLALTRFGVSRVVLIHRTGRLEVGETSVGIAVASPHRAPAFEACRFIMDEVKRTVPIWKKECFEDGSRWVEGSE